MHNRKKGLILNMNDPYKTLGVSPTATDDEIKKAYRDLARKYHPDNYAGSDLADLAEEKMKEVNEAYEQVKKLRSGASSSSSGSYSSGYGYGGFGFGGTSSGSSYGGSLAEARRLIAEGSYANAEIILDAMSQSERNAEWHYLKGCILMKRGAYFDAQRHIDTACSMDPGNAEYAAARNAMRNSSYDFGRSASDRSSTDACDCCTSLLCADCLCECLGGNLIPCC